MKTVHEQLQDTAIENEDLKKVNNCCCCCRFLRLPLIDSVSHYLALALTLASNSLFIQLCVVKWHAYIGKSIKYHTYGTNSTVLYNKMLHILEQPATQISTCIAYFASFLYA